MQADAEREVERTQGRIEELLGALRSAAPTETMEQVEALLEQVVGLYGSALGRMTERLAADATSVDELRDRVVGDRLISTLLVLHGLHPHDVRTRIERALADVSPYVGSHGGKVLLVGIEDDVVSLKLQGACESCPSSASTATDLLERAVRDAAPEITRVEVDTGMSPRAVPPPNNLVQIGRRGAMPVPLAAHVAAYERCEMCGSPIGESHDHVAQIETRALLCVCRPCRLLFAHDGTTGARFRAVSERWVADDAYRLSDLDWARLGIPVRMAFFVMDSTRRAPIGFYPSPGGIIEAAVDAEAWSGIEGASATLAKLVPDVEAWLVDGRGRKGFDGWFVPIDACYELVARVRLHWSGFDGGDVARAKVDEFFANVRERVVSGRGGP